jgi:hypothetical protein
LRRRASWARGAEWPLEALENVVREVEGSDDDRDWERRNDQ